MNQQQQNHRFRRDSSLSHQEKFCETFMFDREENVIGNQVTKEVTATTYLPIGLNVI